MKEIHKILEKKISLGLGPLGYKKMGPLQWYQSLNEFSRGVEIQRSQWSDAIYINFYIYLKSDSEKPSKKHPFIRFQLSAYILDLNNDTYNDLLDLHEGDSLEKTNQIPKLILDGLNQTLNKLSSIKEISFWVKEKKFDSNKLCYPDWVSQEVHQILGI